MNWFDAAIITITGLSCAFGLYRGLIKEVLSLLSWIAALLIAKGYSERFSEMLTSLIDSNGVRYAAAFAMIFIVVMMLGTFLNFLMSKILTVTGLKFADRLLGGVFGIARGALIVLVVLFVSRIFMSNGEQWQQSVIIPHGLIVIEWSQNFISSFNVYQ
ncbi:MAG: CvpA family protein [Gammaproteobacteria bacterium]|nr:CvpA family protein [Gammaproteobacteria bacterium]